MVEIEHINKEHKRNNTKLIYIQQREKIMASKLCKWISKLYDTPKNTLFTCKLVAEGLGSLLDLCQRDVNKFNDHKACKSY